MTHENFILKLCTRDYVVTLCRFWFQSVQCALLPK